MTIMIDRDQIDAATKRYNERQSRRERNVQLIKHRKWLDIDPPERVEQFLRRRAGSKTGDEFWLRGEGGPAPLTQLPTAGALERMIGQNDLMGVAFLERGLRMAQSVGRVWVSVQGGQPAAFGTGFLVAPRLMLTNHHVLEDSQTARNSVIEFNYQLDAKGVPCPTCTFAIDPDAFFVTSEELDYTMVAVATEGRPLRPIADFPYNSLIEEQGKVLTGQWMNIIQHPNGEPKQLCLRQNQLVDILDNFLHYHTDTAPGSSGSPVFNDRWEVVALHHSGVWKTDGSNIIAVDGSVWHPEMGEDRIQWTANEGVRISRIIAHARAQAMSPAARALMDQPPQEPSETAMSSDRRGNDGRPSPIDANGSVASDGTYTVTVPVTVSLRFGGQAGGAAPAPAPTTPPAPAPDASRPKPTPGTSKVNEVLAEARRQLRGRADVVDVDLGYVFRNGWITNERAIVVTVRDKKPPTALRESRIDPLPDTLLGMPVEVTSPGIKDMIRMKLGDASADEVFGGGPSAREITYKPLPGTPLNQVSAKMRVIAHVSPDAGWAQLEQFLAATKKSLSVAMYDFGAPHIEKAVEAIGKGKKASTMTLVMQKGESIGHGTKKDDLPDDEVVDDLKKVFKGKRFENAWVKLGKKNGWVSSSYHIKVAVRDSSALWLSSGNWQSSNQPNGHPLDEQPPKRTWLNQYNRDWHAIVEHAGLAKTYEAYIEHDLKNNPAAEEALELPDVLIPAGFLLPLEAERPFKYFKPFDRNRSFTVTPLLTPDNFYDVMMNLVKSAKTELLIQNQTFNAPGENHDKLRALIQAVMDRIDAGVDVKVIFRILMAKDARENLEALKDMGFPTERVKVQKNCHTKAVIVDSQRVAFGSQNWSNDGVSVNRDASLLFEDAELAKYFHAIFDHDWAYMASQNIGAERGGARIAGKDEATPAGMVRLTYKDYLEMQ